MAFSFPGGIGQIRIADADDFDDMGNSSFVVVMPRNSIAKEGTEVPDPEAVTAQLADDREVRMGINQGLSIRLSEMDIADFDTLEGACNAGDDLYIEVESAAKTSTGDPRVLIVYQEVILSNVAHAPVSAERGSYGTVIVDGMATGFSTADIYTLTTNS